MAEYFRGRFEIKIDSKGRFLLPSAVRQLLPQKDSRLVFTNSQHKQMPFLDLYPVKSWLKLEKKIATLPQLKAEVQAFTRFYLSAAQFVELDSHGRLLVPSSLRKHAGLEGESVLIGMGEKLELWSMEKWQMLHGQLTNDFDSTLEVIADLTSELGGEK
jgi:MraZ protein